jgi:hypothetical protein
MREAIVLLAAIALMALAGSADAAGALVAKGKGRDGNGLDFSLRLKNGGGSVAFETNSFGNHTGPIDCFAILGPLVMLAGPLDEPGGGLTHYMIVAEDHRRLGGRDELTTWLRNGTFDCETEVADPEPDSLVAGREPIERGKVVVKNPPN